jgi:hypothetical protein
MIFKVIDNLKVTRKLIHTHDETDKRNDANKQTETSDKDETGVEEDQKEEASEHDETGKKKKVKKQKETGALDSTDNTDDKRHVSKAIHRLARRPIFME